jgi:CSLREA domain-containing protein
MKTSTFSRILIVIILCTAVLPAPYSVQAVTNFVVTSTENDDDATPGNGKCATSKGVCTLRAAITEANQTPAVLENITFNIPIAGQSVIQISTTPLPAVRSASINGMNLYNTTRIVLHAGNPITECLLLEGNNGGTIQNLQIQDCWSTGISIATDNQNLTIANNIIVGNGANGIYIGSGNSGSIIIKGNYLGLAPDGITAHGNYSGVAIHLGTLNDIQILIGGSNSPDRNFISGNENQGVLIKGGAFSSLVTIQGNYIGTNAAGNGAVPNAKQGIMIWDSGALVKIGGDAAGDGNLISGNTLSGISLDNCAGTVIEGNLMSSNAGGTAFIPNGPSIKSPDVYAVNSMLVTVGGTTTARGNVMLQGLVFTVDTDGFGVSESLVQTNKIGITRTGFVRPAPVNQPGMQFEKTTITTASFNDVTGFTTGIAVEGDSGVTLRQNRIWGNTGLGIDLISATPGVTPNDILDPDSGPNSLQNFPVITAITRQENSGFVFFNVAGTLNSTASTNFRIELFNSESCDASGYGEGQKFIADRIVTTDVNGNASWAVNDLLYWPTLNLIGTCFSATTTHASGAVLGSTSEFSAWVRVYPYIMNLPIIKHYYYSATLEKVDEPGWVNLVLR